MQYTDPSGKCIGVLGGADTLFCAMVVSAVIGGVINYGTQVYQNYQGGYRGWGTFTHVCIYEQETSMRKILLLTEDGLMIAFIPLMINKFTNASYQVETIYASYSHKDAAQYVSDILVEMVIVYYPSDVVDTVYQARANQWLQSARLLIITGFPNSYQALLADEHLRLVDKYDMLPALETMLEEQR